ncbi:hypothetical protein FVE85_4401 [Porphyridium purpureum]|uniref:Uncharacterized protein n=1 Tax=Porphyridium purpureum TaxID=35688 RepID=A0A5J4YIV7_PORPP|nr:hypothetical protein FVE85_4401 [Porphyridium purpureum]|eukprot:POR6761..scf270_19
MWVCAGRPLTARYIFRRSWVLCRKLRVLDRGAESTIGVIDLVLRTWAEKALSASFCSHYLAVLHVTAMGMIPLLNAMDTGQVPLVLKGIMRSCAAAQLSSWLSGSLVAEFKELSRGLQTNATRGSAAE